MNKYVYICTTRYKQYEGTYTYNEAHVKFELDEIEIYKTLSRGFFLICNPFFKLAISVTQLRAPTILWPVSDYGIGLIFHKNNDFFIIGIQSDQIGQIFAYVVGRLLTLGLLWKLRKLLKISGYFFPDKNYMLNIVNYIGWVTFCATFSQTQLVTLIVHITNIFKN
jgi:hypothetical protein